MLSTDYEQIAKRWVIAAEARDAAAAKSLMAEDIIVCPPFLEQPVSGIANVMRVFGVFVSVTEKFRYGRIWTNQTSAVLEFTAEVDGKPLHGLDIIELNADGKICRFDICARSLSTIKALADAAKQHLS